MSTAQQNFDGFLATAAVVLPTYPNLYDLVGTSWLPALRGRTPGDGLHPLLDLLYVVPGIPEAQAIAHHLDTVVKRLKASPDFDTILFQKRLQPRLLLNRIASYREWHSLLTEFLLRDFLEQRGVSATLTSSGPDILIRLGAESAAFEIYTPMKTISDDYISDLLWLTIDRKKPVDITWDYQGDVPEDSDIESGSADPFLQHVETLTQAPLPQIGSVPLASVVSLGLKISEYPYPHVRRDQDIWSSPTGLQDWLTENITAKKRSMLRKVKQLQQHGPSILVISPGRALPLGDQIGALGFALPDPWNTFRWPADLPATCIGILLWWYRIDTSAPWQARLLVSKSRGIPSWLPQVLDVPVIEVDD